MNTPRPKNIEPNCINNIMLMAEDKMPPKNRYSLRFASKAAPVKHAKIAVEPRKATVIILPQSETSQKRRHLMVVCLSSMQQIFRSTPGD